jgi:hypothetical protein
MDAHDFAKVKIPDRYRIPAPNFGTFEYIT